MDIPVVIDLTGKAIMIVLGYRERQQGRRSGARRESREGKGDVPLGGINFVFLYSAFYRQ